MAWKFLDSIRTGPPRIRNRRDIAHYTSGARTQPYVLHICRLTKSTELYTLTLYLSLFSEDTDCLRDGALKAVDSRGSRPRFVAGGPALFGCLFDEEEPRPHALRAAQRQKERAGDHAC